MINQNYATLDTFYIQEGKDNTEHSRYFNNFSLLCVCLCAHTRMCVCARMCDVVVVTPVYNTSVCEIDPQQCRCFFSPSHHPPSAPNLFKARVDKTTDCGVTPLPVVAQVGLRVTTPLILVPQSVLLRVPGQASGVCSALPHSPLCGAQGTWLRQRPLFLV